MILACTLVWNLPSNHLHKAWFFVKCKYPNSYSVRRCGGSTVRCALRTFSLDSARAHAPSKQPFLFARKNPLLFQTGGQFREGNFKEVWSYETTFFCWKMGLQTNDHIDFTFYEYKFVPTLCTQTKFPRNSEIFLIAPSSGYSHIRRHCIV